MALEKYLLTASVGDITKKQIWQAGKNADLDLPGGWSIELQDGQIHIFDTGLANPEERSASELVIDSLREGEYRLIDLPPSARDHWRRAAKVELTRLSYLPPVYNVPANNHSIETLGPKQVFAFYGQDYLLVRYRPVGAHFQIILSGHKIFSYAESKGGGEFVVKSFQRNLQIEVNGEFRAIPKSKSFTISESDFFNGTFWLGMHWWRFRLFPSPDSLHPLETDETEEDLREKERFRYSVIVFLILFSGFWFALWLGAKLSKPPPKIVKAVITLKTPKIIPPFQQKKPEIKKPHPVKKKIVHKKRVIVLHHKPKPIPHPHPAPRRVIHRPIRKHVARVRHAPVRTARKLAPPHQKPVHTISPAAERAEQLAKQRAAQQAQVMKSLSFLSSNSTLPTKETSHYHTKHGAYANVAMIGGAHSRSNVLDRIARGAPGNGSIHTRTAEEISSNVRFGNRAKGLNKVQGRVSLNELYSGGGSLGRALGGSGGIHVSGPGKMSDSMIERTLARYLSKFEYCYEKALLVDPNLGGDLLVQWNIGMSGGVSGSRVLRSTINNNSLHGCVLGVLNRIHFPHPRGGSVTVKKNFSFTSSSI